jgi:uncharacterized membrane protein YkoI
MRIRMKPILLLFLLSTLLVGVAEARPSWMSDSSFRHAEYKNERKSSSPKGTSLDSAVNQVKRETGGKILSAQTVNQGGKRVHRIKVLTPDQRVRIININADR